jgi:hypothetical protein
MRNVYVTSLASRLIMCLHALSLARIVLPVKAPCKYTWSSWIIHLEQWYSMMKIHSFCNVSPHAKNEQGTASERDNVCIEVLNLTFVLLKHSG